MDEEEAPGIEAERCGVVAGEAAVVAPISAPPGIVASRGLRERWAEIEHESRALYDGLHAPGTTASSGTEHVVLQGGEGSCKAEYEYKADDPRTIGEFTAPSKGAQFRTSRNVRPVRRAFAELRKHRTARGSMEYDDPSSRR